MDEHWSAAWLVILFTLSACDQRAAEQTATTPNAQKRATDLAAQDRLLLDSAERHYAETTNLAQLAASRTERQDVRGFAADLISDAQREAAFARIVHDRVVSDAGTPRPEMSEDLQRIASLRGREFDAAFAAAMQKDLQDGMDVGADAARNAVHPDVKTLGNHLTAHDRKFIERLREIEPRTMQ